MIPEGSVLKEETVEPCQSDKYRFRLKNVVNIAQNQYRKFPEKKNVVYKKSW